MAFVDRNGTRVYYEVHGSGRPVLLTHGFSETLEMWRGQVDALAARHSLILWDMPGHGRTICPDQPEYFTEDETIADMGAIIDALGLTQVVVGGLSLGGYMSLAFHRSLPERVAGLLVVDTGPGFRHDEPRNAWNMRALATAAKHDERARSGNAASAGLANAARGMLTQRDASVIECLSGISCPTMVVVGANDTPFLAAADMMANKIPHAEKHVIPGAGHMANIDRPEAFNGVVLSFLERIGWSTPDQSEAAP